MKNIVLFFVYVFCKYLMSRTKNIFTQTTIPIYWINLDSTNERRMRTMHRLHDYQNTRVSAYNTTNALRKIIHSQISHVGVNFYANTGNISMPKKRREHFYSYKELACTLSHIKAIQKAYNAGHNMVIVTEDDVVFLPRFWSIIGIFIETAPANWDILQLYTTHLRALKHVCNLNDPWIIWKPYLWGAQGYIINRKGMQKILSHLTFDNKVVVADEFIYHGVNTYMTTYPQIAITGSPSLIQVSNLRSNPDYANVIAAYLQTECKFPSLEPIHTKQSLAIITSVHSQKDMQDLQTDRQYLQQWHKGPVQWYLTGKSLPVEGMQHIQGIPKSDWVLLRHAGIRLVGFPWKSFFRMAEGATVTGALRAHHHHHLIRTLSHSDTIFEMHMWQSGSGKIENTSGHGSFTQDIPILVDMVEKSFALLNGTFARQFFRQKRTDRYDYEWCGEASLFDSKPPCQIMPFVVQQEHKELKLGPTEPQSHAANYSKPFREAYTKSFSKRYRALHLNDVPACLSHWSC